MEQMHDTAREEQPPRSLTPYPPESPREASETKEGSDATDDDGPASEPELEQAMHAVNKNKPQGPNNNEDDDDGDDVYMQEAAPVKPKPKRVPRQRTPPLETKGPAYEAAIATLRKWLSEHLDDPYPDADQKQAMSEETGLTYGQVQHWFINARMRYLRPMIAARKAEMEAPKSDLQPVMPLSLSALTSVATHAAPMETVDADSGTAQQAGGQVDQTVAASASASAAAASSSEAAASSPVVPPSTLFDLSRTLLSLSEFAPISDAEGNDHRPPRKSSHSATKPKPKPQGLSAAIFSNGQSKAGRVVKRKSTSLEEDEAEDLSESDAGVAAGAGQASSSDGEEDDEERNKKRKGPRGFGTKVFDPKQRRSKLPLKAVGTLRAYFLAHIDHPFPRDTDKARLAEECGLAFKQVSDWFTNTRKRFWRPYADRLERLGCGLVARPTAQPCTCRTKKAAPAEAAAAAAAAPGSAAAPEDAAEAAPVGLPIHSWPNMWN